MLNKNINQTCRQNYLFNKIKNCLVLKKYFSDNTSILIKSGTIVNADEKFKGDILVEKGKVKKIYREGVNALDSKSVASHIKIIDAKNKFVIPGGIDTHTHMQLPFMGTVAVDDFNIGSRAAISGGTTCILDFAIPEKGESILKAYEKWRGWADAKVNCDYSLHVAITEWNENVKREMAEVVKRGVSSFKVFLAYKGALMLSDSDFIRVLERTKELGAICMVHAENGDLVYEAQQKMLNLGITGPEGHYFSRTEMFEESAVNKASLFCEYTNAPLYIVHVMSKEASDAVLKSRIRGNILYSETLAAALGTDGRNLWNKNYDIAAGHVMSPPLNPDPTVKTHLMKALQSNIIQTVGTDNCTFCMSQKRVGEKNFTQIPNGVNGIEDRMSIVWTKGVKEGLLSPSDFVRVTSTSAAQIFNMYPNKGVIKEGADADLVVWNGETERIISKSTHRQAVDFNIFEGMKVYGESEATIVNGKVVWSNGEFETDLKQGSGKFVPRKPFGFAFERVEELDKARDPRKLKVDRNEGVAEMKSEIKCSVVKTEEVKSNNIKNTSNSNISTKNKSQLFDPATKEFISVENCLEQLSSDKPSYDELYRILYGNNITSLETDQKAFNLSLENNFEIKSFKINSELEQTRSPRIVKIGAIQNSIVLPTTDPIQSQKNAIFDKVGKIIEAAYYSGVNVICLQECWNSPFFMCTREKLPWTEFAESALYGESTVFLKEYAKKYNMVIISTILERDDVSEVFWNSAVIIGNNGEVIGKCHKNHIPRVGDFNESTYYMEGETGNPVFKTDFGLIGVNICYGRHHPLHWMALGLNGAEIVFNPAATVSGLSEPLWSIEARNAAVANSYFSVGINRVGTEVYPNEFTSGNKKLARKEFGHFYGSSYVTSPDGTRTPGLSRVKDGLLVTEVDLNLCRQTKDHWGFPMTARFALYAELLKNYTSGNYKKQII